MKYLQAHKKSSDQNKSKQNISASIIAEEGENEKIEV